jgi:hypothetical protein
VLRPRRLPLRPRIRGLQHGLRDFAHKRFVVDDKYHARQSRLHGFNHKKPNGPNRLIVPLRYRLFIIAAQHSALSRDTLFLSGVLRNKPVCPPFRLHGTNEQNGQRRYSGAVVRVFSASDGRHGVARGYHGDLFFRAHIEDLLRYAGLQLNRGPQWLL